MKLTNLPYILIIGFLINTCTYGTEEYTYINIGECNIPIKKKLELINSDKSGYSYSEKNHSFDQTLRSPVEITIEKNIGLTQETIDNIIQVGKLENKTIKNGYLVYTDNKKENNIFFVILNENSIMMVNYLKKDVDFLIDYCSSHQSKK